MIRAVWSEAVASARSQPVASLVTIVMVTGMVLAVMLTTGRTVGAEQQVLSSIDSAGTRSITVRAEAGAGMTSDVLRRIDALDGVEWAAAFTSAVDSTNSAITDGARVPVRYAYGTHLDRLGIPAMSPVPGELAWASPQALDQLGLPDATGAINLTSGESFGVAGRLEVPDFLTRFEPLVLVPTPVSTGDEVVSILIIIVERPDLVAPVSDAVLAVLHTDDPSKISLQTSETLAKLRALVQGQLGSFSRGIVMALLAVTGVLVAILLYGLVMMRRKDFGRRRALGASRRLVFCLLLLQTIILAGIGIAVGIIAAAILLWIGGDPLPGFAFTTALAVLALVTSAVAALVPALVASRREPIRELRVP